MKEEKEGLIEYDDGDICMYIEQESSLHLKVATKDFNDPVELTADEARDIAKSLLLLAKRLDEFDDITQDNVT